MRVQFWNRCPQSKSPTGLDPRSVTFEEAEHFFENERHNKVTVSHLKALLEDASTIFDVGGNSGYFTKEIIEAGYTGRVILFDPIPNLMSISVRTLAHFGNEKIYINAAFGEKKGNLDFYIPKDSNIGWITAVSEKADSDIKIELPVVDGGRFVEIFRPEFIKVDVVGFELFVLRPFLRFIDDVYRPSFLVELGWGVTNPNWGQFLEIVRLLRKKGYKFYLVGDELTEVDYEFLSSLDHTVDILIKWDSSGGELGGI